jgi:hypothetical protein
MTAEPIILNGKCTAIDPTTRTFTMKEVDGTETPFKWTEPLDVVMRKWKAGYYLSVQYDPDTHTVKNVKYWQEGKDQFPREKGRGGQYQSRNEKLIVYQTCYKECCETVREMVILPTDVLDETEFNRVMDIALERAKRDAKELIRAAE